MSTNKDVRKKIISNFNKFIREQDVDPEEVCMFIYAFLKENDFKYHPTGCYGEEYKLLTEESRVGKWVAFTQDGMDCVLHGKVMEDRGNNFVVRNKSYRKRIVEINHVIDFYDSKEDCYSVKEL